MTLHLNSIEYIKNLKIRNDIIKLIINQAPERIVAYSVEKSQNYLTVLHLGIHFVALKDRKVAYFLHRGVYLTTRLRDGSANLKYRANVIMLLSTPFSQRYSTDFNTRFYQIYTVLKALGATYVGNSEPMDEPETAREELDDEEQEVETEKYIKKMKL